MVQDHNCRCFGQQLTPVIRAAAVAAAVGALWHVLGASAQEPQKADSPDASASAMAADEAPLPALPANLEQVPQPSVPPPVNRKKPELVHVEPALLVFWRSQAWFAPSRKRKRHSRQASRKRPTIDSGERRRQHAP